MSCIHYIAISFSKGRRLTPEEEENAWALMWDFMTSLYKSGNILNSAEFFSLTRMNVMAYGVVPDKDALSENNIDVCALSAKEELQKLGITICYNIMAKHVSDSAELILEQNIAEVGFLFLYPPTGLEDFESKLVLRTDKGRYLPTYILNNNEDPYLSEALTFWRKDYAAVSLLWFSSYKKLEPITAKQLAKINSDLSIQGIEISERISKVVRKNVFYPLAELEKDNRYVRSNYLHCPSCSENWTLREAFFHIFSFKCDKCHLLGYKLES